MERISQHLMHETANHLLSLGKLNVDEFARALYMDRTTFYRNLLKVKGCTPESWILQFKMKMAANILTSTRLSLACIAIQSGYETLQAFCKAFKKCYGMAPGRYRRLKNCKAK